MTRQPLPPFSDASAARKVRLIEDAWNMRDPAGLVLALAPDSRWRDRNEVLHGRDAIESFLMRQWNRELDHRLMKEPWTFRAGRIAVRFAGEWRDDSGQWFRSCGNENLEFDDDGLIAWRFASINDAPIRECQRRFHWPAGRRPDDYPSLRDLDL